jgi:hypothetical protein
MEGAHSKYIGNIPVSGNPFPAAEQSISGMLPPWIKVTAGEPTPSVRG